MIKDRHSHHVVNVSIFGFGIGMECNIKVFFHRKNGVIHTHVQIAVTRRWDTCDNFTLLMALYCHLLKKMPLLGRLYLSYSMHLFMPIGKQCGVSKLCCVTQTWTVIWSASAGTANVLTATPCWLVLTWLGAIWSPSLWIATFTFSAGEPSGRLTTT